MVTKVQIPPAELAKIEQLYTLQNRDEIVDFLVQNPFLVSMLLEAPTKLQIHFPNAPLGLEFYLDYEDANFSCLFILISVAKDADVEDTAKKLNSIWGNWRFGIEQKRTDKLQVTIEYI
jgi:hypothetical protein